MEENVITLEDQIADSYIKSPTKNTLHFHHVLTEKDLLEVTIYNNIEIVRQTTSAAFNYIFIKDSEKHHILFNAIRLYLLPPTNEPGFFPHLTMTLLNNCLQKLHNRSSNVSFNLIREAIGVDYALPKKFEAVMFDLPKYCVTLIHPGVLRCATTITNSNLIRLSCKYRIRDCGVLNDLPNFGRPRQARNYEIKSLSKFAKTCDENDQAVVSDQIWPYQLHMESLPIEMLQNPSIVCFALSKNANFINQWTNYLNVLFSSCHTNPIISNRDDCGYRNPNQLQSKHIPNYHGRTCYGHCLVANFELFQKIEPIVTNSCHHGFVTTCDFAIQYIPVASTDTTSMNKNKRKKTIAK
jgi:hypothetical protein